MTTILARFSASGDFYPSLIFKGKRVKSERCVVSPPKSMVSCSKSGRINSDLLLQWAEEVLKMSSEDYQPRLLLLDEHVTRTYNVQFRDMMKN